MKHLIEIGQRLNQTISPQMYQSLNVLQMNSLQLEEHLKDMMLENPVLEAEESFYWEPSAVARPKETARPEPRAAELGESLREYLVSQFDSSLSEEELGLLERIISHLDDAGYLEATVPQLAAESGFDPELVEYAIAYIQSLDPTGVCAASIGECLGLQLRRQGYTDPAYQQIVDGYMEEIAAGHYSKIGRQIGRPPAEVRAMCNVIKSLNPKPGGSFGGDAPSFVFPDIIVTVEGEEVRAEMKDRHRSLRISDYYARLAGQDVSGEAAAYLEEKLSQARWLLEAVESRRRTMGAIADTVCHRQREFFLGDDGALMPMTLGEMARQLGVHESTVSRAVSGKVLSCSRGIFPLKYFFAAGISGDTTREQVKQRVRVLIEGEDKANPLSDKAIEEILRSEGIGLSRRVIAKYRGELGIPGTNNRKV